MRILYHHWLSPFARKVRLVLGEKRLDVTENLQADWDRSDQFLALNPAGEVPVLIEPNGLVLCDSQSICEYLEEAYPEVPLLPRQVPERAETRRLVAWFDRKFQQEVTHPLVSEKLMKRMLGGDPPDSRWVRVGRTNIHNHLAYITWLTERRKWLAGGAMTLADITAAAHLSLIDYIGDVPWDDHPFAKDWYVRIKSRPCFRPLLREVIPGVLPPKHYADLDF
ncbi:FtsZ-binding protein FzlA [Novispirillum itersonii]|uniref:FtsZ-binding protein FzlA n=1 Tax=Novispirillum itersonii TaxID=189 RepID=UPI000382D6A5|nr:glutathione S-transferase family protein [Novispirillum itersonii]